MTFAPIAQEHRDFLVKLEQIAADHSPGAIFRRARRASMADAPRSRAWKARALDLDPAPLHNAIALSGMAPMLWEERWHLAVALPQPSPAHGLLDPIDDVVLIDPKAGTTLVLADHGRTLVASSSPRERVSVTTDAKAWARAIALDRLEWWNLRAERRRLTQAEPTWTGDVPMALLLGSPSKARWSEIQAKIIDVPADLQRAVNRAVYQQARLPQIEARA